MNSSRLVTLENTLRELPIIKKELARLTRELSPSLSYHSVAHTDDVIHEVLLFGYNDELSEKELRLLAISATFHDSGFLVKSFANEAIGADFAAMAMEAAGAYSKSDISLVTQMILDTEIHFGPTGPEFKTSSLLSGYLLDADLSNFGREDFFEKSKLIAQETNQSVEELKPSLIKFLNNHHWHTIAAQSLRQEQKEKNLAILEGGG
jgi:uncharacterized protein